MNRAVVVALSVSALLAPVAAQADPIGINVLSATYSASLTLTSNYGGGTTTATANGSSAVSQSLDLFQPYTLVDPSDTSGTLLEMQGSASADWLAVDVNLRQASSGYWFGQASADFDVQFSPVADGNAALGVAYTKSGEYGSGLATLFDVTTQQQVWKVTFGSDFGGCDLCSPVITEGSQSFTSFEDPLALATALNAGDVYELHLIASTLNPGFGTFSSVQVSGLVSVPEPSSLMLLGFGLVTLSTLRRASATNPNRLN